MSFQPRPYQIEAINAGVDFLSNKRKGNGLIVLPTGSGKSVVIANTTAQLTGKTLILQPSKEILEQNFKKYLSYGYRAGIYSASAGVKHIDNVTFATIGSIAKKPHLFSEVKNIIIDECHLVNAKDVGIGENSRPGMYKAFIQSLEDPTVLGYTATPYRLSSADGGSMLKFITRTSPKIFNHLLYFVQNDVLFNQGYLAKLEYFNFNVVDRTMLRANSNGSGFDEASVKAYHKQINMPQQTAYWANRMLSKRKNLLVFCSLVEEAIKTAHLIDGAVVLTGKTEPALRDRILRDFTSGRIRCVVNVGVLTTGFDYPALEAILIARSTMSLALYYQMIGRVMRPHPEKESGWVVDLGGNYPVFGKVETMKIIYDMKGLPIITNNGRQLTNVTFTKN